MKASPYDAFARSASGKQWGRLGLRRRAGVIAPLFSIHSADSAGVGEFPDVVLLADWCRATGQSLIQLLPLNDVGFDFQPYSAQSAFALEPLYLSLRRLDGVKAAPFLQGLADLTRRFPAHAPRVDYGVKAAKLAMLWEMFQARSPRDPAAFARFRASSAFWLDDYALFKVLKERHGQKSWEDWPEEHRLRRPAALEALRREEGETLLFHQWVQWQCFEQLRRAKSGAAEKGVFLVGDLPFLVSRDSADVWARQDDFKLDLFSGAPPDLYFSGGQRWGMPPYRWDVIAARGHDVLREKLRYAGHFFDLFRVDHVIGAFRLYTIPAAEPPETAGLNGLFDPADEKVWEDHGRALLKVMLDATDMLPCGEDLGVVPPCSYKVLAELGVPGLDVQRWTRDWQDTQAFIDPRDYRKNSVCVVSTHDMSTFHAWWLYEAGTVDEALFRRLCQERGIDFEAKKEALFDLTRSGRGRLRWRPEVKDASVFLWTLGKPEAEVRDFLDIYKSTYDEKPLHWSFLGGTGVPPEDPAGLLPRALEKAAESASIFSLQLIQDLLALQEGLLAGDSWDWRVNFPGTLGPQNWTTRLPLPLEDLLKWSHNPTLRALHQKTRRL